MYLNMKIFPAVSLPPNMLPELLLQSWQKHLKEAYRFTNWKQM